MKRMLIFVGASIFLFAPLSVFASSHLGLVPTCEYGAPFCQGCDLVKLFDNLLRFAVYFSAVIATLMFAYAGFLYVTASVGGEGNLTKAKDIFGKVLLGFVFVLSAWLIVNVLMNVFLDTGQTKYPWNEIKCEEFTQIDPVDLGSVRALPPGDAKTEAENRALIAGLGVGVNNPSCQGGQTTGCTDTAGMSARSIGYVGNLKTACDASVGASCDITVTGASEGGHSGGTRPGSHGAGDKVDLRVTSNLNTYVDTQVAQGNFTVVQDPTFGVRQYQDTQTGAVWTYESTVVNGQTIVHYDVCTANCSSPSAQGS